MVEKERKNERALGFVSSEAKAGPNPGPIQTPPLHHNSARPQLSKHLILLKIDQGLHPRTFVNFHAAAGTSSCCATCAMVNNPYLDESTRSIKSSRNRSFTLCYNFVLLFLYGYFSWYLGLCSLADRTSDVLV